MGLYVGDWFSLLLNAVQHTFRHPQTTVCALESIYGELCNTELRASGTAEGIYCYRRHEGDVFAIVPPSVYLSINRITRKVSSDFHEKKFQGQHVAYRGIH